MSCLETVKKALLSVSENVGHYEAVKQDDEYIVWAEDGGGDVLGADNMALQQVITGRIDLFTRRENSPLFGGIQKALREARVSFALSAVQYEDETRYIHYTWDFEVS